MEVGKDEDEVDAALVEPKKIIGVEVFDVLLIPYRGDKHGLWHEAKGQHGTGYELDNDRHKSKEAKEGEDLMEANPQILKVVENV